MNETAIRGKAWFAYLWATILFLAAEFFFIVVFANVSSYLFETIIGQLLATLVLFGVVFFTLLDLARKSFGKYVYHSQFLTGLLFLVLVKVILKDTHPSFAGFIEMVEVARSYLGIVVGTAAGFLFFTIRDKPWKTTEADTEEEN